MLLISKEGIKHFKDKGLTERNLEFLLLLINTPNPNPVNLAKKMYVCEEAAKHHITKISAKLNCKKLAGLLQYLLPYITKV